MTTKAPAPPANALLEYCGPAGQESPSQGPLEPGAVYQWPAEMAAYLVAQHPTHWRRPQTAAPKQE